MSKSLKHMLANQLQRELVTTNGCLLLDPGAMTVEGAMAFRKELREKAGGARLRVIHNRTARHAIEGAWVKSGAEALTPLLRGSTAIAFGGSGPVPIAKVVVDWKKKAKNVLVKGAVHDGEVLGPKDAEKLATLPGLPELRGQLVGLLAGGARGLVVSMNAVLGGLARVIKARADSLGSAAPAAAGGSEAPPEAAT